MPPNANSAIWILFRVIMWLLYIQLKKPIRYEKRCYSDVRSKAYMSQINLQHGTTAVENRKTNKKLCYHWGTARCVVSVEILPTAMQQWRNYLYNKSWRNRSYVKLQGYTGPMCNKHVHSITTQSSRFHCPTGVINKPTTDVLWISPVYRRLAVVKFSKSTM